MTAPMNKRYWWIAAALLVLTAVCSTGHHQRDEHFQILEFAAYKLGLAEASDLPWEFHDRMRPALQPAMAYLTYRAMGLGEPANPFHVALVLRLFSAGFSLWIAYLLHRRYATLAKGKWIRWFALLLLFHWCWYYNGVRFSSENWSGLTLVAALLTYPLRDGPDHRRFTPGGGRSAFFAGMLFGIAFLFRYQVALAAAGFGVWLLFVHREHWRTVVLLVAGGLAALLLAYPLTYWLYGEWTLPAWNYLAANLIEGKAATYGTEPWYGYLELVFLRGIPPLSIVYLLATIAFCWAYRRDPLSWMVGVFVVAHSLLARKDVRFLFPLIPLLPVLILGAGRQLEQRFGEEWSEKKYARLGINLLWGINLLLLASVVVRSAASEIAPQQFVYDHYGTSLTLTGPDAEIIVAEGAVSRYFLRPGVRIDTAFTGGPGTCGPGQCLYLVRSREAAPPPQQATLVYTDRPAWADDVNVFGWVDRQKWWRIYAIGK